MRGQASIEYVVVVALVAVVTAVATTIAAPGIANDVARAFRRALCVVGGGDCLATERRPCVTSTAEQSEAVSVELAVLRLGRKSAILRRRLSDGSVAITVIDDTSAGAGLGFGAHGRFQVGGVDLAAGGMLQLSALARLGVTHSYHAKNDADADRIVDRLMSGTAGSQLIAGAKRWLGRVIPGGDDGRRPDSRTFSAGAEGGISAQLRGFPVSATAGAGLKAAIGGSAERATGRRTFFLDVGGEAAGALKALVAQGRVAGATSVGVAVTYDRRGRPLTMSASISGDASGSVGALDAVPAVPRPAAGADRRIEVDATLDLGRPDNAAAVERLLGALDPRHPRPGAVASAARDLGARLVRQGDIDLRSYESSSSSQGVGGSLGAGAKIGAGIDVTRSSSRLRAAWSRPGGGVWELRIDCASGAAV